MSSRFFIDKKLKKKIEKDIKKRNDIEEQINKLQKQLEDHEKELSDDLDNFYNQVDSSTVLSTLKHYEEHSNSKQKDFVKEIELRFNENRLLIQDALTLTDWYEKMCDYYNKKI